MKLPNFMCRIVGHKTFGLGVNYTNWKKLGVVAICFRCGKGYGNNGWVPGALEKLRALYPDEKEEKNELG